MAVLRVKGQIQELTNEIEVKSAKELKLQEMVQPAMI